LRSVGVQLARANDTHAMMLPVSLGYSVFHMLDRTR
jgi:hypothetical protein